MSLTVEINNTDKARKTRKQKQGRSTTRGRVLGGANNRPAQVDVNHLPKQDERMPHLMSWPYS